MKKRTRLLPVYVVGLIVLIQFWPVERTNPRVSSDIQTPKEVEEVLRAACYDCHSNETRWPWYSHVAPVSWLIAHDVTEARDRFNLSEWGSVPAEERQVLVRQMWKEVEKGGMPLPVYRIMHPEARLSENQKSVLRDWALSSPSE